MRFLSLFLSTSLLLQSCVGLTYAQSLSPSDSNIALSIVQVMAYDDIYGLHPVIRGWGSASVIDDRGLLLTNNHVVSDENGNPMSAFAICRTVATNKRPDCSYTASLIARDSIKDIALLRIDNKNIENQTTDYSLFPKAGVNYNYTPNIQDSVVAIGYPRIGIDTITQTMGVVAGIQEVNDQIYLKTDALIEGGNSGGPLVQDNMIIGINTFTYGGGGSLGYALSVSEIKDFITKNKEKEPQNSILTAQKFQESLSTNENINKTKQLSDEVFDIRFDRPYVITNYIKNNQVAGRLQVPSDIHVGNFSISLRTVPYSLSTEKDIIYTLKESYGYQPERQKIIKMNIGGIPMVKIVNKDDLTHGENERYQFYIGKYDENTLVEVAFGSPSINDETKADEAKKNRETFLKNISFRLGYQQETGNYKLIRPSMTVNVGSGTNINIVDSMNNVRRNWGWSIPFVHHIIDKDQNSITLTLSKNLVRQGKNIPIDKIYKTALQDIPNSHKKRFSLDGNEGYVYCTEKSNFPYRSIDGITIERGNCKGELYLGVSKEYILSISMDVQKSKFSFYEKKFFPLIQRLITLEKVGEGITDIPTTIITKEKDMIKEIPILETQSEKFKTIFNTLLNKKVINTSRGVRLDEPATYRDTAMLYIKMGFNENPHQYKNIFNKAGINPDMYIGIENEDIEWLKLVIDAELAGAKLPGYDRESLRKVVKNEGNKYDNIRKIIQEYYISKVGERSLGLDQRIPESRENYYYREDNNGFDRSPINTLKSLNTSYNGDSSYIAQTLYIYDPLYRGLISEKKERNGIGSDFHTVVISGWGPVSINSTPLCDTKGKKTNKQLCAYGLKKVQEYNQIESSRYFIPAFNVATIGEVISNFAINIDTGLFDEEIGKKRNIIDEYSI